MRQADHACPTRGEASGAFLHRLRLEALKLDRQQFIVIAVLAGAAILAFSRGAITEQAIVSLGVLVPAIILHEVSHGAVAYLFGDDTAKRAGRLTLNPLAHIDPFGTVILPALLLLSSNGAFGYAKPVPVNPRKMRDPRNHGLLVSLAGPATNIVLALIAVIAVRASMSYYQVVTTIVYPAHATLVQVALVRFGVLNMILAAFNLIPLPPLDGSAVVERLLPAALWPGYLRLRQYSMAIILVLVFLVPGVLGSLFNNAFDLWLRLVR